MMKCGYCGSEIDLDGEVLHRPECRGPRAYGYPDGWPACACGAPVLDGHLTCGALECDESAARDRQAGR